MENLKSAFTLACTLTAFLMVSVAAMLIPVAVMLPEKLRSLHFPGEE